MHYVQRLEEIGRGDVDVHGGKGAHLGELIAAGLPVPPGFVLTTAAYDDFVEINQILPAVAGLASMAADPTPDDNENASWRIRALFATGEVPAVMAAELRDAYHVLGEGGVAVAVRSSATAEDLAEASFAGQQDTYLNVRGDNALLGAVKNCWASLWTARAMAYRARQRIAPTAVSLAVVVQQMVDADAAGVMFTANPSNGRRNELVVAAAWGLGESVVSGSVTTDDLILDKATGHLLSRRTADKQVMTVCAAAGTREQPVPEHLRGAAVLDDDTATRLARLGTQIEGHYGSPQDVEWALAGGELSIVQARPITALPEPVAAALTEWAVPIPHGLYFRASIVEQLPDPLSPLFADLAADAVPRSQQALFGEFLTARALREGDIALPTVNGYAYLYYTLGGLVRLLLWSPAALRLYKGSGEGIGQRRWRDYSHPRYVQAVEDQRIPPVTKRRAGDLLAGVRTLLYAGAEYYTAVQAIIPLAASTEFLFTAFYQRFVRRAGDPAAATLLLGFDSMPIRAEKSLYDLAGWVRGHDILAAELLQAPTVDTVMRLGSGAPASVDAELWRQFRSRFQEHLDRYGHAVYNLDFLNAVPADDPATLIDTLTFYLRGEGSDPHQRQQRAAARGEQLTATMSARLDPARRTVFVRLLRRAQSAAPLREDALGDVGLAWPSMRQMLREIGRRLVETGAADHPDDVFWLREDELAALAADLDAHTPQQSSHRDAVAARKALWRGQRRVTPPQLLPEQSWFTVMESWMPAVSRQDSGDTIRGLAASAGTVTAPARVLTGPEDFPQMRAGEVLVAAITTPAWTSLFPKAAAVVTDIGGPLSHSSIVAREYGVPAVLGTGTATRRIRSGQQVRVDGDAGTVTLLGETGDPSQADPAAGSAAVCRLPVPPRS